MASKRRKPDWVKEVGKLLESVGATRNPGGSYHDYALQSKYGKLEFTARLNHEVVNATRNRCGPGSVFARFEDVKAAVAGLRSEVNPFSGKWNHHYFSGWKIEEALAAFRLELEKVLVEKAT
jgi:hypothetical protein